MTRKVIDIESSDLLANMIDFSRLPYRLKPDAKLWCIVVRDIDTKEVTVLTSPEGNTITKEQVRKAFEGCTEVIAHNGIKFDFLALKLFGVMDYEVGYLNKPDLLFGQEVKITDTLIRSRLFNPDRFGGHSLEAWGKRVGDYKDDFRQKSIDAGIIPKNAPKGEEFRQYSNIMRDYCITPDMRLLGQDMKWKEAKDFGVGDVVLGFDEYAQEGRKGRRYKDAKIEVITETEAEVFEVTLESGKVLKVTEEHRFLVARDNHGANTYEWVETKDLRSKAESSKYYSSLPCLLPVYEQATSFDAGWVSGMFDGEGCLTKGNGRPQQLAIAQRPTQTLEKLESLFNYFDVKVSKRCTKKTSDCVTLHVIGGFSEVYRTLMLFRPERLVSKVDFNTFGRLELRGRSFNDGVVSVKSVGMQTILKIQTSARTFMCEGYPMHNCIQDTAVTEKVHFELEKEFISYPKWAQPEKLENKLADIAIRRESYGFAFDRDLAIWALDDLQKKMKALADIVNPKLPPKNMNKGTLKTYTPPKLQLKQDGTPTAHMVNFAKKHGAEFDGDLFIYKGYARQLPFDEPIETEEVATIDDLDHVKMQLINLGWRPTEFKVRDLTKNSKKQSIPYDKRVASLDKWLDETFSGKYQKDRLEELNMGTNRAVIREKLLKKLESDKPVKIPTSPSVRVGVEKELCPNLVKLGDKVAFAGDFALYLTYRHRKSSIAGGDIEDMDFDEETPNTGFLAMYREVDGRVPTPAIEIGASCVPASTRLLTWDGYKKIVDVKIGDKVLTHEGTYQVVTDCIDNGVKPTFKVTLSNGMTLTCTANHPFYTTEGWVRCEDLVADNVYVYGEKEVWKDAVGFDGYKVSSWGSVVGKRGFEVKPLTSNISGRPCSIDIYTAPHKKTRKGVGRLVCEAFNSGDSNLEVRHLDGNSWNNNAENLVFGTSAENSADWKLHGSCGLVAKVVRKLTDEDVSEIKRLVSLDGKRGAHGRVAKTFNVSREHIRDICSGKKRSEVLNTTTKFVQSFKTAKVISVEYVCDQPTFDITVEDAHSYVAEGIVVHNTNRYRHIGVCNIARASSVYGDIMRSMFGCGKGRIQLGQDAASLEACIQGHYILPFNGDELAEQLLASKPNDIHCYSEDTEILTPTGWKTFGALKKGEKVAQYDDGAITFVEPLDIVWQKYEGMMYEDPTTKFKVTPNHRVLFKRYTSGTNAIVRADEFKPSSDKRYIVGGFKVEGSLDLSDAFIKLLVATQADGHLAKDCSAIQFSFVKESKVVRLESILQEIGAQYRKTTHFRKGRDETSIRLNASDLTLQVRGYLSEGKSFKDSLLNLPLNKLKTLVNEVKFWDGTERDNGDVVLDTTDKVSCEFVQTVASLVGYKTNFSSYVKTTSYGEVCVYRVYISTNTLAVKSANKPLEASHYKGFIGCVSVPSGLVVVKRKGEIVVSGNTLNAIKLFGTADMRDAAKSISYALMYGASYLKLKAMLNISDAEALQVFEDYWNAVLPLKKLKEAVTESWKLRGKTYVVGVDGRKIRTRSQHSLLNALFQSGGVICMKYVTVFLFEELEGKGLQCNPFEYEHLDVAPMIEYHK